ncbi:cyclic nucleotide-binding domain-containing protein 2-like isoform X2 [Ptychodera flava]|uniref:cyclic nucleotide-binding domain-containing protein 2-like isoform X2 n=1 Tax=Ptychodera flava TaxID=63121 RepID=UPI00396A3F55
MASAAAQGGETDANDHPSERKWDRRNAQTMLFEERARPERRRYVRRINSTISLTNSESTTDPNDPKADWTPYMRFRRAARVLYLLCTACLAYMKAASASAMKGSWLEVVEKTLQAAEEEARKSGTDTKNSKATIISAANPDLTFDATKYLRFSKREDSIPGKIKEYLRMDIEARSPEIVQNIVRTMQQFEEFAKYPPDIQAQVCKHAWWDKFGRNRVICREGQKPEGLYIVISGKLTENTSNGQTFVLKKGDKFGESDLMRGSNRRSTVMTKGDVELFCLHGQDYDDIFNTKLDLTPEACLEYLREFPVFKAWPGLDLLLDAPSTVWGFQNYRPGQVIVPDSRENEYIYIVKSGKCDVLKKLVPRVCCIDRSKTLYRDYKKAEGAVEIQNKHKDSETKLSEKESAIFVTSIKSKKKIENFRLAPVPRQSISAMPEDVLERRKKLKPGMFVKIPRKMLQNYGVNGSLRRGSEANIPSCVKLSELLAGDCFGVYTVLPGAVDVGVSLVSRGAEAIRISKAFFMKHADEPALTQIKMRYEPYPSQDKVLEELDISNQWEEYKHLEFKRTLEMLGKQRDLRTDLTG